MFLVTLLFSRTLQNKRRLHLLPAPSLNNPSQSKACKIIPASAFVDIVRWTSVLKCGDLGDMVVQGARNSR